MALLKTYSINSDVTAKKVDPGSLVLAIKSGGWVAGFEGVDVDGDALSVNGSSFVNEPALDAEVLGHSGVKAIRALKALVDRVTTAQRLSLSGMEPGVEVYDTDLNQFHWWNGTKWSAR